MKLYAYEVIDKMVERIEKHGWAQGGNGGANRNSCSPGCLLITLSRVLDGYTMTEGSRDAAACFMVNKLTEYLKLDAKEDPYFRIIEKAHLYGNMTYVSEQDLKRGLIANWNDNPDRTRNQVLKALASASLMAILKQDCIDINLKSTGTDKLSPKNHDIFEKPLMTNPFVQNMICPYFPPKILLPEKKILKDLTLTT